ncbi:MAG: ArsA-related P-loop ATPase, partial [Myxococcota bacterium]
MKVTVIAGTGGAGKTTTSAALALAHARAGERVLALTLDPARRLFDAFERDASESFLRWREGSGEVHLWMPTTEDALAEVAHATMGERAVPFLNGAVAQLFTAAPAGLHEIVLLLALHRRTRDVDHIVIDTAPSAHALAAFDLPARMLSLFDGRVLGMLEGSARGGFLSSMAERLVRSVLERFFPADALQAAADFYRALGVARRPLQRASEHASRLLASARVLIVAAPTEASVRGARQLRRELDARGLNPALGVMNRVREGLLEEQRHWTPEALDD